MAGEQAPVFEDEEGAGADDAGGDADEGDGVGVVLREAGATGEPDADPSVKPARGRTPTQTPRPMPRAMKTPCQVRRRPAMCPISGLMPILMVKSRSAIGTLAVILF